MGSGIWSTSVYDAARKMRGGRSAFGYSDSGAAAVHPDLDPRGVTSRDSRDSAEHPASLAIRGFHPYTTWSTTTFGNAEALLAEAGMAGAAIRLGVTRTYMTRHGPGPFVTEDPRVSCESPGPTSLATAD